MPSESRRATRSRQQIPKDDEESDDPLALTPLRQSDKTHRRPVASGHDGRLHRSVDRVVGGVEMAAGDLIPPSDEEEFDVWAAGLVQARRMRAESPQLASSPTHMTRRPTHHLLSDEDSLSPSEDESVRAPSPAPSSALSSAPSESLPDSGSRTELHVSPRIPLYSLSSPKRRCMTPLASTQPMIPQQPRSSYESQYNQVGFFAANSSPAICLPSSRISQARQAPIASPSLATSPPRVQTSPTPAPLPSPIIPQPRAPNANPADSALQQYQSARVFRTRTALQLQPYTRERQVYEAVLRKGGIKKAAVQIQEASSEEDFASPEASQHRIYRSVDVTDEDRAEYYIQHGQQPENDSAELQKIARTRLRAEKELRRKQRSDAKAQKESERLLRLPSSSSGIQPRVYRQVEITNEDRSENFEQYGREAEDDSADMQKIARTRIRAEKEQRRKQREDAQQLRTLDPPSPLHFEFPPGSSPTRRDSTSPLHFTQPAAISIHDSESSDGSAQSDTDFRTRRVPKARVTYDFSETDGNSPRRRARSKVTGELSDSDEDSRKRHDPRSKIAGRMLPAVMLKRLAGEKQRKRPPQIRVEKTAAPGRAVRRQGAGDADVSELFNDESSDSVELVSADLGAESGDTGSQAEEDNQGETLARLYEGDFDTIVRGPRKRGPTRRRRAKTSGRQASRRHPPRLRLNERAIFSTVDFDLAPPEESLLQGRIDTGVGKAKSWANLEHYSADFDISPLPFGLECTSFPIPRITSLLHRLSSEELPKVETVEYAGLIFDPDDIETTMDSIERYFQLPPSGEVTSFLGSRVDRYLLDQLDALETRIENVINTTGVTRNQRELHLESLWYVLEIRMIGKSQTVDKTVSLILQILLLAGFDKAIRPLKRCLRGESSNGKITDPLTCYWVAVLRVVDTCGQETLVRALLDAIDQAFHFDLVGPVAAERIWYITFGLCAISQFNDRGRIPGIYESIPRWSLVRKALSTIKITHEDETEEKADINLFRGRDRYVRVMMARCVRLSAVWKWGFNRDTFPIITRDLGATFKQRQYRNFPSEPAVDYPDWITSFDISQTSQPESKHETAFELYLRLICVAASDMVSLCTDETVADKDIQRLVMSIIPVSPVKFNRLFPPTPRQLPQLINRYAAMVAACYFSPSILLWLLANSRKWSSFENADFDSRQISIRGLMYVAVACRRHDNALKPIIERLSEIMSLLQVELENGSRGLETQRTMVLVVSCYKQMILQHSFNPAVEKEYPDPSLLDPSWTLRIFDLSAHDHQSGLEVVSAVQAFLDARASVLPLSAKRAREERLESQDEFGSFGFDLDPITVAQLGGDGQMADTDDAAVATIIGETICPRIYRLLSDLLSTSPIPSAFVNRLTVCWADCAAILVVDHRRLDWATFIGPFGSQSWLRFGDDIGRVQVGLYFMLSVLKLDSSAFGKNSEDFIALFFSVIGTDRISVEHKFITALFATPACLHHPLFEGLSFDGAIGPEQLFESRFSILDVVFSNLATAFSRNSLPKPFLYRCLSEMVSGLERSYKNITGQIPRLSYQRKADQIIKSMRHHLGSHVNPTMFPGLKAFTVE